MGADRIERTPLFLLRPLPASCFFQFLLDLVLPRLVVLRLVLLRLVTASCPVRFCFG